MAKERGARPVSVGLTGWLCVGVGGLMLLSAALLGLGALMRALLEEQGQDPFAALEGSLDPLSRMIVQNLKTLSVVQVVVGILTIVIGLEFLRMRPWARPALEIYAWVTLAASAGSGAWGIYAWLRPGDSTSLVSLEGIVTPLAGMILTLAQCVACALILRYLRSPETRAVFRGGMGIDGIGGRQGGGPARPR